MKVGIPKEIKNNENRVGMTPAGVAELARRGHEVSVQHTAGEGSGFVLRMSSDLNTIPIRYETGIKLRRYLHFCKYLIIFAA